MNSLATIFSASGRIAPRPFALGAVVVYVASFLSQFLLAAPITARASVVPFLLVQIAIAGPGTCCMSGACATPAARPARRSR